MLCIRLNVMMKLKQTKHSRRLVSYSIHLFQKTLLEKIIDWRMKIIQPKRPMGSSVLMTSTGDAHIMLPRIKYLHYKEMTLMLVLFLIEKNAFWHFAWNPKVPFSCIISICHPVIYYFSLTSFFEIGIYICLSE